MPKLKEDAVKAVIKTLEERYDGSMADGGDALHKHIVDYVQPHFHRRPSVKPKPPSPWQDHGVQWPGITSLHRDMKARLCENEATVDLDPVKPTSEGEQNSETGQDYFADLFNSLENSLGYSLQSAMADGLIDGAGVLHWWLTPYSQMPDYDEVDDLGEEPEDDRLKKRYAKYRERYTEDDYLEETGKAKKKKYREKDDAYLERVGEERSKVPVWQAAVVGLEKVYFELDRSPVSQFKRVLYTRELDVDTWYAERMEKGGFELSEEDLATVGEVPMISVARDTATSTWGKTVKLKQLWDREYCYELVDSAEVNEKVRFQCYKHPYGMPPFAVNGGAIVRNDEPRLMYESPYELLFQLKPVYDRWLTLSLILAESQSVPRFILVNTKTGAPMLNEKGDGLLTLTGDAASSMQLPDGYDLKQFGGMGVTSDFKGMLEWLGKWLDEASPSTGRSTFGASTQPWSARIEQAQNNMEPKLYLTQMANALKVMVQNMVDVMAKPVEDGGPGKVWFSRNSESGRKTQSVEPDQWEGMRVEINIDPVSAAEKGAKMDLAMMLLEKKIITPIDLYGDHGMGLSNPQKKWAEVLATFSFIEGPLPGILRKEQALALGPQYAYTPAGPDGVSQFVDGTGSVVDAKQVAQGQGAPPNARDVTPNQMPSLPSLSVPGGQGPMNSMSGMS